ncbi:hypothetical protein [Neptunomonas sp.]|uniref:hypothetical protein n=1 Tax=Neptunomonas sp. TaxID=1971898 RepID=UPI0025F531EF|nr:hypothetical protein [Neptunomonas sp.]
MKIYTSIIAVAVLTSGQYAHASCTYKQADEKATQVTNLVGSYGKDQVLSLKEHGKTIPEQEAVLDEISEKSFALGIEMGALYENNPNMKYEAQIDPTICQRYDALLTDYAREDTPLKAINYEPEAISSTCNSTVIWERLAAYNTASVELLQAGKITKDESYEYQSMMVEFGQHATTDLAKACQVMDQLEAKLANE